MPSQDTLDAYENMCEPELSSLIVYADYDAGKLSYTARGFPDVIRVDVSLLDGFTTPKDAGVPVRKLSYRVKNKMIYDLDNGYAEYTLSKDDPITSYATLYRTYLKIK